MPKFIDLTNQKIGRLTVVERAPNWVTPGGTDCVRWKCVCECGNITEVFGRGLHSSRTKSCGCLSKEKIREQGLKNKKHGLTETSTFNSWMGMRSRCNNPKNNRYHIYGGRGIKVCQEWEENFLNFLKDMGECPEGMTLERKNRNGNYEPENCVWASQKDQQNNRFDSKYIKLTQDDIDYICSFPKKYGYLTVLSEKFQVSKTVIIKALKLKKAYKLSYEN